MSMAERFDLNPINPVSPQPKRRRVTLAELSAATGLARTTISDILNRNVGSRYSEDTRRKVQKAMRELGYTPSRAAQQLARGKSGQLGLMLTRDFSNPTYARIIHQIETEIRARGYAMQMALTQIDPQTRLARLVPLPTEDLEGLLIGPINDPMELERRRRLIKSNYPVVTFGLPVESEFDAVTIDPQLTFGTAIEHLYDKGHRKIGYLLAPPQRTAMQENNDAFAAWNLLNEAGLTRDEWFLWQADSQRYEDQFTAAERYAKSWLDWPEVARPTAILVHTDQAAFAALAAFHKAGIRVPEDVSIIGFENSAESAYTIPALTTVDTQMGHMIKMAIDRLIDRIKSPEDDRVTRTVKPVLVERGTVRAL
jgi:LacI family transcriptional regulator